MAMLAGVWVTPFLLKQILDTPQPLRSPFIRTLKRQLDIFYSSCGEAATLEASLTTNLYSWEI